MTPMTIARIVPCPGCLRPFSRHGHALCHRCRQDPDIKATYRELAGLDQSCQSCGGLLASNLFRRNPDGLCWLCSGRRYVAPEVLRRIQWAGQIATMVSTGPTNALPGSAWKIAVLIRHAEAKLPLVHPRDARRDQR